jgi:hypothetical protein
MAGLTVRVNKAAEEALTRSGVVTFTDVLVGVGWLAPVHVDLWKQGRVAHLQELVQVRPDRIREAWEAFATWTSERGLDETETSRWPAPGTGPSSPSARPPIPSRNGPSASPGSRRTFPARPGSGWWNGRPRHPIWW